MQTTLILPIEFSTLKEFELAKNIVIDETKKIIRGEIKDIFGNPKFKCTPGFECEFLQSSLMIVFRCTPQVEGGCDHNAVIHVSQAIINILKITDNVIDFSWSKIDELAEGRGSRMFGGGAAVLMYNKEPEIMTTDFFINRSVLRIVKP